MYLWQQSTPEIIQQLATQELQMSGLAGVALQWRCSFVH